MQINIYNLTKDILIAISNKIVLLLKKNHPGLHTVLIVGLNIRSLSLAESIMRCSSGYTLLGFADNIDNHEDGVRTALSIACSLDNLEDYISKNHIDEVFVTLPVRSFYDKIAEIIGMCNMQGVKVNIVNDLFCSNINIPRYINEDVNKFLIDYNINSRSLLQHDVKRVFDIIFSSLFIILSIPVFVVVAAVICFDDGWPFFFAQDRVGLNKRRFKMFKFRTMIRDAEKLQGELELLNEVKGAAFKITKDPRITKSGEFLRKTSLDEIPQFFNVFKGDMSIVGPRPLPVRDFERFYRNAHRRRFSVKPGITGLWQVSGRSDISFEGWMNLDLHYIDNWSLILDFKILLKTIPAVLRCKGAK